MVSYFVVLLLSILLLFLYKKRKSSIFLFFAIALLAFFVGLRSEFVGTDTPSYVRSYLSMNEYSNSKIASDGLSTETGWNVLNWILYQMVPHYWFLFTVVGFFTASAVVYIINRESPAEIFSLFFYITLGFYLFGFAGMRQSVALAFYCLSIPFLLRKDFKRYAIIVVVGSLFHRTILIGLPLYFIFHLKYSVKSIMILVGGSLLVSFLLPQLMSMSVAFEERYSVYTEIQGGGELFAVFYTMMALFFLSQRLKIVETRRTRYDILMMMLICGAIIYLIVTLAGYYGEITRFAMYFQLSIIFLWAELYKFRKRKLSSGFWLLCILIHLAYYYIYLNKIGHTVPYIMNSSFN